jgi:hypothetical protein
MKKILIFISLFSLFCFSFKLKSGNNNSYWKILEKVSLKIKYNPQIQNFENVIVFSKDIKRIVGKKITLSGILLSKESFFEKNKIVQEKDVWKCYGPQKQDYVVIEIEDESILDSLSYDQIEVEGILKLNKSVFDKYSFYLKNAKLIRHKSNYPKK